MLLATAQMAAPPNEPNVEADRRASIAFQYMMPPRYYGSRQPMVLTEWLHSMEGIFATCHIPLHLQVLLASGRLQGEALAWWLRIGLHEQRMGWQGFREQILAEFAPLPPADDMQVQVLPMLWADWGRQLYLRVEPIWDRYEGEPVDHYILRFRRTMMPLLPPEIPLRRICDLIWQGLPMEIMQQIQYPRDFPSLDDFIIEVLHAEQNVVAPLENPPMEMDENDEEEEEEEPEDVPVPPEPIIASDDESTDSSEEEEEDPEEDPENSDMSEVDSD